MSNKLEAYLEEISRFLSGRVEREEILSEIRSHIMEKAAEGPREFSDAAIEKAIAAFGPARKVAEEYIGGRPIIAPGLDEINPPKGFWVSRIATAIGAVVMLAITDFALYLFARHQTIFFVNLDWTDLRPLFTPGAGRRLSMIVIAMFATSTITLLVKLFTRSRWVDVGSNIISLGLIGLVLRQPFDNLFAIHVAEHDLPWIKAGLNFMLIFIASVIAVDLFRHLVHIGRRKLCQDTHNK
jgi:HAAS